RKLSLPSSTPAEAGLAQLSSPASMSFMRAYRDAGIADFHFHDLRHTCAAWLRQKGVQLDLIQKQLGHKDLRMTARYAHIGTFQVRDAVNSLRTRLIRTAKRA